MYVLAYFIALGLVTFITNKTNEVESNEEFLHWEKQDVLILGGMLILSIVLQILDFILPKVFIAIYGVGAVIAVFFVNKNREKHIQEYKKQIEQIFQSLGNLVKVDPKQSVDYNDLPFTIEREDDKINEITVIMAEPNKFNDANCSNTAFSLNRYFPYYQWKFELDFPKQEARFIGEKLPPTLALYPWSDLRPSEFIPLGLGGAGEVGIDLGVKDKGESSYVYEDGTIPGTVTLPPSPQWLVVGATGGGKSIWVDQEIW